MRHGPAKRSEELYACWHTSFVDEAVIDTIHGEAASPGCGKPAKITTSASPGTNRLIDSINDGDRSARRAPGERTGRRGSIRQSGPG